MTRESFDQFFMARALEEARTAAQLGEVPAGCLIVAPGILEEAHDGHPPVFDLDPQHARILAATHNLTETRARATAHAEMLALDAASEALGHTRLVDTFLYVTKEPCPMCAGAIVLARPRAVIWGVSDPKRGGETVFGLFQHPGLNHHPTYRTGVLEVPCREVLTRFFQARRPT